MRESFKKILPISLIAFLLFVGHAFAGEPKAQDHGSWSFNQLGLTPVQSGGRLKPFDSFAREVVLFETGSRSFEKWNSVDLLFLGLPILITGKLNLSSELIEKMSEGSLD